MSLHYILLLVASLLLPHSGECQRLTAIYASSRLPTGRFHSSAVYDGDDIIYILGGYGQSVYPHREICRFNITSDTLEVVGGVEAYQTVGFAEWDNDPNRLLFFAGEPTSVYHFEMNTSSFYIWDRLPYYFNDGTSVKYNSKIYFFGGSNTGQQRDKVVEYDPDTGSSRIFGTLPIAYYGAYSARIGSRVFLIGGPVETRFTNQLMVYDLDTGISTIGPPGFPTSPYNQDNTVVADDKAVYMLGPTNEYPTDGLIKINPDTLDFEFVYVDNWPLTGSAMFQRAPVPVYVNKLNRIYFFGGDPVYSAPPIDTIWYVEV